MTKGERPPSNAFSGVVQGSVVQAGSVGHVTIHQATPRHTVPSQLPAPSPSFTSRDDELAQLRQWLDTEPDGPLLVVVSGAGGVGKTTLALRWLHDARDRFPDGQLYVDLGAFAPTGPVEPEQVLEWFLLALGVPATTMPQGLAQREATYRSLTADRAVAVLLDNAYSAAQVRPLLPATSRSVVAVTSRWRLAGLRLNGARFIELDPMSVDDSMRMLDTIVGAERFTDEPGQAEELARLCGGMPIALSVVGARLSAYPHRSVSRELQSLRGADRLATLTVDESSVAAIFDVSYAELPILEQRTYRICALHPGSVFGLDVAAAAVGDTSDDIEDSLADLVDRNLIKEIADRRFRYHDLLLVHARQQVRGDEREPAVQRMIEWYLNQSVAADLVLRPTRRRVGPRFRARPDAGFTSQADALDWLTSERRNIMLAVQSAHEYGWDELTWEFCEALWGFYLYVRNYDDSLKVHALGIPAAIRCGDANAEAQLRAQLASALTNLRRYDEAIHECHLALRLADELHDEAIKAVVLGELAGAVGGTGDLTGALEHLTEVRQIRLRIGTERAAAQTQRRIGEVLVRLHRYDEAIVALREAADAMASLDRVQRGHALNSLGALYLRLDKLDEAVSPLTEALEIARELGSAHYVAGVEVALGDVAWARGDVAEARSNWSTAMSTYSASGDPKAADVAKRLERKSPPSTSET
ncbi:tetratricopeptide repeat protein [Actinocrispum wychmicini]|uniref:Putative ATPase n=1 Tax=Actinocrispum wychmicini TaxID=1213861 RepID=A0A4R2J6R5_9PSEU|nr:tetratricopeptide repeat protein [Actinocrispum wychmicini]TCO50875.1 putative ATPase [Actinocrispum wychmicini]